jgi:hypothetical protein
MQHRKTKKTMEDIATKKTAIQAKKLGDYLEEIISAQSKTINALECTINLLHENIALKEKMSKAASEAHQSNDVIAKSNGIRQ